MPPLLREKSDNLFRSFELWGFLLETQEFASLSFLPFPKGNTCPVFDFDATRPARRTGDGRRFGIIAAHLRFVLVAFLVGATDVDE